MTKFKGFKEVNQSEAERVNFGGWNDSVNELSADDVTMTGGAGSMGVYNTLSVGVKSGLAGVDIMGALKDLWSKVTGK